MLLKLSKNIMKAAIIIALSKVAYADNPAVLMQINPSNTPPLTQTPSALIKSSKKNLTNPKVIRTKPECVKPTTDSIIEGRRAFVRMNCYSCHGSNGHGSIMGPSLVNTDAEDIREAVMRGEGEGMPAFRSNLCPGDLNHLVSYIQALNTPNVPTFDNWWEPGPSIPSQ